MPPETFLQIENWYLGRAEKVYFGLMCSQMTSITTQDAALADCHLSSLSANQMNDATLSKRYISLINLFFFFFFLINWTFPHYFKELQCMK